MRGIYNKHSCILCGNEIPINGRQHCFYNGLKTCSRECQIRLVGKKNSAPEKVAKLLENGKKFRYKKGSHPIMTEEHRLNIQKAQLARREDARIKRLNQKHVSMKDNKTEQIVKKQLDNLGYNYEANKKIYNSQGKYIAEADIFIQPNIIIYCDGCAWHACPIHLQRGSKEMNDDYLKAKDERITSNLLANGYKVRRIWEHDITKQDFDINILNIAEGWQT